MRIATPEPLSLPTHDRGGFVSRVSPSALLGTVGICALFFMLRWQTFDAPLIRDEGEYAYAAQLFKQGQLPYEHSFLQKPPMVVYTYALANALAPNIFWMPRVLAAIAVAASTMLLGFIVYLEFGSRYAFPAMWFFTPMVLMPKLDQSTANTEMFMLLPLMGTFAAYALDRRRSLGAKAWLLAGSLSAMAVLYKYTVFPLLACLWLFWAVEKWRASPGPRMLSRYCLYGLAGAAMTSGLILFPFIISDGGQHLWECTVLFNRSYTASSTFGIDPLYIRLSCFWEFWRVLFFLPLLLLVREPARIRFWLGICAVAWVSTAGARYSQYYVPVMPFWALICAVGLVNFLGYVSRGVPWLETSSRRFLTAVVLLLICLPNLPFMTPGGWPMSKLNLNNPFSESLIVAKRVAELTGPDDPVYIAGSEPQILYYAGRKSPTRFVIAYPFMIPGPFAEEYQAEAIADLKRTPSALIVRAVSNASWLDQEGTPTAFREFLGSLLQADYERIGGYVLGDRAGYWIEPISDQDGYNASLLVFKRKTGALKAAQNPCRLPQTKAIE